MSPPDLGPLGALDAAEVERGLRVAATRRVAVFVVAYEAEDHIEETLRRIPADVVQELDEIYMIDDSSTDDTLGVAGSLKEEIGCLQVFRTPYRLGYGGNQKLGYEYAVRRGFDVVVLLHGDGQYAPEVMHRILAPFEDPDVAAVFGTRMAVSGEAHRGGMPVYKQVGNRVLTTIENTLLGSSLSEFHSGYRAYSVRALDSVPFRLNTSEFHFDTEIIIQLLAAKLPIVEVPIPTHYGDEVCRVQGVPYALRCLRAVLVSIANRVHLLYDPRFEISPPEPSRYKMAPTSLHQHVVGRDWVPGTKVVEYGSGHGELGSALARRGLEIVGVDRAPAPNLGLRTLEGDLDAEDEGGLETDVAEALGGSPEVALALDVLEHLAHPEQRLQRIWGAMVPGGRLLASTANVAFFPLRLMLLLGQFNYGRKGILDLTHRRLYTIASFQRLLHDAGFEVEEVRGFGPPILDEVGDSAPLRLLDRLASWLAWLWPSLFAYQFLLVARRRDSVEELLAQVLENEDSTYS
jgi:2-polyprenyl-3-methyl-5-hydroxy-6-metoxy-1,4-benzoquinol methylase